MMRRCTDTMTLKKNDHPDTEPSIHTSTIARILRFLRSHPVLCLFFLTPGIAEYINGSSPVASIVLSPPAFIIGLVINAGLYLPGALLIREAVVRWKKGWASVLLLGAAYGILEEGIALGNLFNPRVAGVAVQVLGRWYGVNWIICAYVIPVHMVFSIALPILLLELALPSIRGKSLLASKRGIAGAFAVLGVDVYLNLLMTAHVDHFWMGWIRFGACTIAIAALIVLAYKVPTNFMRSKNENPSATPLAIGAAGVIFTFFTMLILVFISNKIPSSIDMFLFVLIQTLFMIYIVKVIGKKNNERQLIALALGLILPLMVYGVITQIELPLVLIVDVIFLLFLRKLWHKYNDGSIRMQNVRKTEKEMTQK